MSENNKGIRLRVTYSKTDRAKYISHLDTIDIISKAVRRLNLQYEVTQGCHIRPILNFGAPLPLGHASFCEYFVLTLKEKISLNGLEDKLSNEFPSGMKAVRCEFLADDDKDKAQLNELHYRFSFTSENVCDEAFKFLNNPESSFEAFQKKKLRQYRIGEAVKKIEKNKEQEIYLLEIDFIQGLQGIPSVSKIVTALAHNLGDLRSFFVNIERISFNGI